MSVETLIATPSGLSEQCGYDWQNAMGARLEVCRRNYLLSLILLDQTQGCLTDPADRVAAEVRRRDQAWRDCGRLLFSSIRPVGQTPMPQNCLELLSSLVLDEGRYEHDLSVPIPHWV